ncbi:MAG: ABC transporter ATP-binding protein [Verrucomicrobia bacterium]|jgi:ABC-type lipoprotein export system ATPase subunit|nr:ABC transporter ATP-binding protein [Verrucomicrobiota bacterium]
MYVELSAIEKVYRMSERVEVPALRGIDLSVEKGEFVALVGPSGCGKTTLLSVLGLLTWPTAGTYCLDGCDTRSVSRREQAGLRSELIGFIFQSYNLLARETAWRNVMFPLTFRSQTRGTRKRTAMEALDAVGLADRADHYPSQLSGGEQQRVAVARALVNRPRLLIADEPTGNLDSHTGKEILELIIRLAGEYGTSIVMATHDLTVARRAGRIVSMADGGVVPSEANG